MLREGRKLRGRLIRLVLNRRRAILAGSMLGVPSAWLLFADYGWENRYTEALGLICGATGVALVLAGIGGRRPDWIEPESGEGPGRKM